MKSLYREGRRANSRGYRENGDIRQRTICGVRDSPGAVGPWIDKNDKEAAAVKLYEILRNSPDMIGSYQILDKLGYRLSASVLITMTYLFEDLYEDDGGKLGIVDIHG